MSVQTVIEVLQIESEAIASLIRRLDRKQLEESVSLLAKSKGRVVTTGMGKSGIIARKIAATLSSTGTPSIFLHPAEAVHGDLGMLVRGDTLVMISNSGETNELLLLMKMVRRLEIPVIALLGNTQAPLSKKADFVLDVGVQREACPLGLAPTASTTCALALGDAIAIAVSKLKGFQEEAYARLHPAGRLGKRLALVEDLMHVGSEMPVVLPDTTMEEVIYEMSRKGLGITAVVNDSGILHGCISDGDLRRLLQARYEGILKQQAKDCMTIRPITIRRQATAGQALADMERRKITALFVTEASGLLVGVLHLHDLWGAR